MKKSILLTLALFLIQVVNAQDFQFQMYFEDANGNKDTLTFGYDTNGTEGIDVSLGEDNILGMPLDSLFDVRISDAIFKQGNATFHTKKQIVPDSCSGYRFPVVSIDIHCKNWPVTASWDNALFTPNCILGSVFTSMHPGGWWDVGGHPSDLNRIELVSKSQVTFTSNYDPSSTSPLSYAYVNSTNDTIPVFWMAFGDSSLLTLGVNDDPSLEVKAYPNPVTDLLNIDIEEDLIQEIHVVNLLGVSKRVELTNGNIDMRNFQAGNYVLLIHCNDGRILKKKIIKN